MQDPDEVETLAWPLDHSEEEQDTVQQLLSRWLLRDSLPQRILRKLDKGLPLCVSIEVPGPEWCGRIAEAAGEFWPKSQRFVRDGSLKHDKPSAGNDMVSAAVTDGRAAIGISHAPGALLPSSLLNSADARAVIKAPTPSQLKCLLRACAAGPVPRTIAPGAAQGLSFDEIAIAFRKGASAKEVLLNLARCKAAKLRPPSGKSVPPLENLPGYIGARRWGLEMKAQLALWRAGRKKWDEFSNSCVLFGPPGTGKTMFAQALARSCDLPIVCTSVGQWFIPDGHLNSVIMSLQTAWDTAKSLAPSILFIDELDALPDRERLSDRNRDYWIPLITHCLCLFDGAVTSRSAGIVLLGATNHVGQLDKALVRPGRFDRMIEVPIPGPEEIAEIIAYHLRGQVEPAALRSIAQMFPWATPAHAAQWARDAREAAGKEGRPVTCHDVLAVAAPPDLRTPEEIRRVAIHESAHAIVARACGRNLDHLSIMQQGDSGGRTLIERLIPACPTLEALESAVVIILAGRAGEEIILGEVSAGAETDLAAATEIVCALHASQGLGGHLVHLAASGRVTNLLLQYPKLLGVVDAHILRLYGQAKEVTTRHRSEIARVASEIAMKRVLRDDDVTKLLGLET